MNCHKYQLTRFLNHSVRISVITIIPNEGNVWLMLSWQCHSKKITERSKVEQSSVDGIELKCNDSEIIFTLNSIQVIGGKQNASTVITLGGSIKNKNKLTENYPACFNGTSTSKSYLLQRWIKRFSAALRTKFLCCHFRGINGIGIYTLETVANSIDRLSSFCPKKNYNCNSFLIFFLCSFQINRITSRYSVNTLITGVIMS